MRQTITMGRSTILVTPNNTRFVDQRFQMFIIIEVFSKVCSLRVVEVAVCTIEFVVQSCGLFKVTLTKLKMVFTND